VAKTAAPRASDARPAAPVRPVEDEPGPLLLVPAYVVLLAAGIVAGLLGAFLLSAGPRTGGGHLVLPVGLVLALVLHPLAVGAGLLITGSRAGTLTPLVGWSMVVLPLSSGTSEGDVVLPGTTLSLAYLAVGVAAFAVPAFLVRPTRGRSAPPRR
jgi:hypothetical protein